MEKIAAKSRSSQAKVIGSIISIAGAFVLTLYKSPSIIKAHSHDLSLPLQQPFSFLKSRDADWVIVGTCLESRTEYFINLHCLHSLKTTSSSSFVLCRSLHNKISQNSLDLDPSLSRISHMQKLFEKMAKILSKI
ncbi:hypothetical protein JHK87_043195 [Glycine soja]|nr:hypothetical protein JHK87_043195 [Glycine soja]